MSDYINKMRREIEPIRQRLIQHPVYAETKTIEHLRLFMEHHVFAVWDFMSLLKALQRNLTCIDLPWIPVGDPETRYLINEIVLGEESDIDENGKRTSHFELYLRAMDKAGCNLNSINAFIRHLEGKSSIAESLSISNAPLASIDFIQNTFAVLNNSKPHVHAAVFTFGREDLIPGMFLSFVSELNKQSGDKIRTLKYYLERHIEVDGEHHSDLAYKMTEKLNGTDPEKWQEAIDEVKKALFQRIKLWDAIALAYKR
ncbi:DUF3050 domain-containing protein [Niastella populi]|uniref:Heme oxygenase n=1 Tax=Niastella populi TaxID=550983 RepID=A0A1V9EFS3_9BACT|nr:DUF3050 domain-containing protein [Niastella populi]OQP44912.1 heme oxygenase [Niastella populi]